MAAEQAYMTYILTDVIITGVSMGGSGGDRPQESLSLTFARMERRNGAGPATDRATLMNPALPPPVHSRAAPAAVGLSPSGH